MGFVTVSCLLGIFPSLSNFLYALSVLSLIGNGGFIVCKLKPACALGSLLSPCVQAAGGWVGPGWVGPCGSTSKAEFPPGAGMCPLRGIARPPDAGGSFAAPGPDARPLHSVMGAGGGSLIGGRAADSRSAPEDGSPSFSRFHGEGVRAWKENLLLQEPHGHLAGSSRTRAPAQQSPEFICFRRKFPLFCPIPC